MSEIESDFHPKELGRVEARDPEAFLTSVFDAKQWGRDGWGWTISQDGEYIDMGPVTRNGLADEFVDEKVDKVDFVDGSRGVGLTDLLLKLEGKKVKSLLSKNGKWFLKVV